MPTGSCAPFAAEHEVWPGPSSRRQNAPMPCRTFQPGGCGSPPPIHALLVRHTHCFWVQSVPEGCLRWRQGYANQQLQSGEKQRRHWCEVGRGRAHGIPTAGDTLRCIESTILVGRLHLSPCSHHRSQPPVLAYLSQRGQNGGALAQPSMQHQPAAAARYGAPFKGDRTLALLHNQLV